jgi:hypothetical protein
MFQELPYLRHPTGVLLDEVYPRLPLCKFVLPILIEVVLLWSLLLLAILLDAVMGAVGVLGGYMDNLRALSNLIIQ